MSWRYNPFTKKPDFNLEGDAPAFTSMALYDTDESHKLTLTWDENDSANRTLGLLVNAGDRLITLSGNPTLGDWFDQGVKTTDKPTFGSGNSGNLIIGTGAGASITSGDDNVLLGFNAGANLTTSGKNVFIGREAGEPATNESAGAVMIGYQSGHKDIGERNVFVGHQTGLYNDTTGAGGKGDQNTYIGYQAGYGDAGGNVGADNVGLGYQTLFKNIIGSQNFALGTLSLGENTSGGSNVAVGYITLSNQTTPSNNVGIGQGAGRYNVTGASNTSIGSQAGLGVTGNSHSFNTVIGASAGTNVTTGSDNTYVGYRAGASITEGMRNVIIGSTAAERLTTADDNVIIGAFAYRFGTGDDNTIIGKNASRGVSGQTTTTKNVTIGFEACRNITTGSNNVALGYKAGLLQTTGDNNVLLGYLTGDLLTTGSSNIIIGHDVDPSALDASNELVIGDLITGTLGGALVNVLGTLVLPKTTGVGIKVESTAPTFPWRDLLGDQFSRNTGGTKPTLSVYNGDVDAWQFSDGDEAFLSFHIPHDYVAGTDIHLHIHWSQTYDSATGGTLDFKYFAVYAKAHNQTSGSVFGPSTPITATFSSIDINDGASGLLQYQQHLTEVVISAATATGALFDRDDFEPDGVIELTFEMDANNLTGVAVTDPFIHFVDIHYQSTNIGTKDKAPDFYA